METFVQDEVLQAAMRFGRKEANGEKGATVYLHTCALPDWLPVEKQLVSVDPWTKTQKNGCHCVINAVRDLDGWRDREWKVREIRERIERLEEKGIIDDSLSGTSVRDWLKKLAEQGYLNKRQEGQGSAYHFSNRHLEEAPKYGHVEFAV
jgi:DNA-binding transcriptional ArsR family regulator